MLITGSDNMLPTIRPGVYTPNKRLLEVAMRYIGDANPNATRRDKIIPTADAVANRPKSSTANEFAMAMKYPREMTNRPTDPPSNVA